LIYLLINYARSGGTLVSKIIASQPNVVFLSEVNPNHNAVYSPAQQANLWYNLNINEGLNYSQQVSEIHKKCIAQGKHLIIRDFSFIDFTPHQLNNFKPKGNFSNWELLKTIAEVKPIAFVRNAIDVWISRDCPPSFSEGYKNYAELLIKGNFPLFKYEAFCKNPLQTLKNIEAVWGLENWNYKPSMLNYKNITGDNQLKQTSRGGKQNTVKSLKRKQLPKKLIHSLHKDLNLLEANNLLGYTTNYLENTENTKNQTWLNFKHFGRTIKGTYPSVEY